MDKLLQRLGYVTARLGFALLATTLVLCTLSGALFAQVLGTADIRVLGMRVDVDTRPDIAGIQYTMTAVKDIPTGVMTVVGTPGTGDLPSLPAGYAVKAELYGPSFGNGSVTVTGLPNQLMEVPVFKVAGDHTLTNIRLVDGQGKVILYRDPSLDAVVINVIDKLLVTQVTSRPLTLDEIREKGIVIDQENFTAMNFAVGLTLGSEKVVIDLPVLIPTSNQTDQFKTQVQQTPLLWKQPTVFEPARFAPVGIPNLTLAGFSLSPPPEVDDKKISIPPINGVIIIPGNIAFLHQFFSVILQASNVAPESSGLVLENASATIVLPLGGDGIEDTGDDPLRVAETQSGGVQEVLPLLDASGSDLIIPQGTNNAEFLVEGLKEGTHQVNFDIKGDLYVPSLGKTVQMTGKAAGVVQVKNPTFSIVLAHPDVVREGEAYSIFATVTNTSSSPANLFQLRLLSRSLSGARLADGETGLKTLDGLAPGQAASFEFHLVARTTGEVTGTVFLADEGINGSFVLTTGVGDTGIPLSPDTLVLPQTVAYLPHEPDLVFAAVRLLGQAYSVATAPNGALPPDISRISRTYVFERGVKLAQAGLHVAFGEQPTATVEDILMDYLGSDLGRLATFYPDTTERRSVERDLYAFDILRRAADAGHDFSAVLGTLIGASLADRSLAELQQQWAELFSSRPAHLSFGASSDGAPACLRMKDGDQNLLGRLKGTDEVSRDIPFGDRFLLSQTDTASDELLFISSPVSQLYLFEFTVPAGPSNVELSLVVPDGSGMVRITYPPITVAQGGYGKMLWNRDGLNAYEFQVDTTGDGVFDQTLAPASVVPIEDRPCSVVQVRQWAKGDKPEGSPSFTSGDPLGRLVGVLFDEEVEKASAEDLAHYQMPAHHFQRALMQPDRRLVFLLLTEPVGPFVSRQLTVSGVQDLNGLAMTSVPLAVVPDPDRGPGGVVAGTVVGPSGSAIPFAEIKYLQPVTGFRVNDFQICNFTADEKGRYQIDYVLMDGLTAENPDIWLNDLHAGGTNHFKIEATDPESGEVGRASTRVAYDGQRMNVNVIIRGYGGIQGTVYDDEGRVVSGGAPDSPDALLVYAKSASTGESYTSWVDAQGRYAFPRSFVGADGEDHDAPRVAVGNVILRVVRLADRLTGVVTANIPAAGVTVTQDIVMVSPNRYGAVSGRVLEGDGTTGAPNVLIQIRGQVLYRFDLYSRTYEMGLVGSTVSDANGNFSFDNVPAGDIEIQAFRQATFEQATAKSYLEEGETKTLTLVFPGGGAGGAGGSGTVRGYVRDALGSPVAGGRVAGGPTLTETDQTGCFEITGLPLGTYIIYGQAPDSPALATASIALVSAGDVVDIVLTLEPVGTIGGTVYEADGKTPVAAQKVQLWQEGGISGVMAQAYTDANGRYQFANYPVNSYSVRAVRSDYGDGGAAVTAIRYAGDTRDADILFRGLGEIKGRVIQSNGTPVLSDVIIVRKVWRILKQESNNADNYYLQYAAQAKAILSQYGIAMPSETQPEPEWYVLRDEPVHLSSNILGPGGEVTGQFQFKGPATAGPFTVSAFGPFLAPTSKKGEIPRVTSEALRVTDIGDIVLNPTTGQVRGTVFLPDGTTPVGENVKVKIRCLDNSGGIPVPGMDGSVTQPVLPEYDVVTDESGQFYFPLVMRGNFILTADTGVPDPAIAAQSVAQMQTERFLDDQGKRALNVRLYGQTNGVVPAYETLTANIRLQDVAGILVSVVEHDGVTPVPYAEVTVKTSSTLDAAEEPTFSRQIADNQGLIDFFPIIEGQFSVAAKDPDSPATGQATGQVPVNPPNGFQVPVKVTLGAVTTSSGQVVTSQIFGKVEGTVYKADGTVLENPAQVTVKASGASLLTTSDADGRYRLEPVPGGAFQVEVLEPFTARRGTATGRIAYDNETVEVPVTLGGLGTVSGQVTNDSGNRLISAADVILYPSGQFTDKLISRTDAQGVYWLPGVPMGSYTVKATDYVSSLTGEATGKMLQDGDTNTTDIRLQPSGSITGVVYAAGVTLDSEGNPLDANGNPWPGAPVVANAGITIVGPGALQSAQTGPDGNFASGEYLKMGTYTVTAKPPQGNDGAKATTSLTYDGQVARVAMAMGGRGTVEGYVLDSFGAAPVNAARVTLNSGSRYTSGPVTRMTGADGKFSFSDIPVGSFSISAVTTFETVPLGSSATGTLERHGQVIVYADNDQDTVHNALWLQQSGEVKGTVLLSDGTTLAEGAFVQLTGPGVSLSQQANSSGAFSFEGLPLATYQVAIIDPNTNGIAKRTVLLNTNGQVLDLADIILDDKAPTVISVYPEEDAPDVLPGSQIEATFSEFVDPKSVTAQTFKVMIDGVAVAGKFTFLADEPTVAFTPTNPLPDLKRITVQIKGNKIGLDGQVLERGISDPSGFGMVGDYLFSFSTKDNTPPAIVSISPANGAIEVAPTSVVRVEFSEPVDRGSIQSFTLMQGSDTVAGSMNSLPIMGDRVFVFTPAASLLPNASYTATITGPVTDLAGNAMKQSTIAATFATIDTFAPDISSISYPEGTTLIQGKTVPFTVDVGSQTDIARVEFTIDNQLVGTALQPPYTCNLYLAPEMGTGVILTAVAVDKAGNRSTPVLFGIPITANQPPEVAITSPANIVVSQGQSVTLQVNASDDLGLKRVSFIANGGTLAGGSAVLTGVTSAQRTFSFTVPANYAAGTTLALQAGATDNLGLASLSSEVTLTVVDNLKPTLSIGSPANNAVFDPGAAVAVFVSAEDSSGIQEINLSTSGPYTFNQTQTIAPAASPASATFNFTIPAGAAGNQPLVITAKAKDSAGNVQTKSISVKVNDRLAPQVGLVAATVKVEPGRQVSVQVVATDEVGVTGVTLQPAGLSSQTRQIASTTQTSQLFTFTMPAVALGTQVAVNATARDQAGNIGNAVPLILTATDLTDPAVSITAPACGGKVTPGETLNVQLTGTDNFGVADLSLEVAELGYSDQVAIAPAVTSATHTFTVAVPETFNAAGLTLVARAVDQSARTGSSQCQLYTWKFQIQATAARGLALDSASPSANVGQTLRIAGQGFSDALRMRFTTVDDDGVFGSAVAPLFSVAVDGSAASVVVPSMAVTGPIMLETAQGGALSDPVPLQIVPTLDAFTVPEGSQVRPGVVATLTGSGFHEGATDVEFPAAGSVPAPDVTGGNTRLTVTIPDGVDTGEVKITTEGGTSNGFPILGLFGLVGSAADGVAADPMVPSANTGQTITVTGEDLTTSMAVVFSAQDNTGKPITVEAPLFNLNENGSQASVVVPASAVTGNAWLKVKGGSAYPGTALLQIVPTLTRLTVAGGDTLRPGVTATLTGSGFEAGGSEVLFSGAQPAVPSSITNSTLAVTVPEGMTAGSVRVRTEGGSSREMPLPGAFGLVGTAAQGTPANAGEPSANIGQTITVTGQMLSSDLRVLFSGANDQGGALTLSAALSNVAADGTSASVTVPTQVVSGPVRLTYKDGVPVETSVFLQVVPTLTSLQVPSGSKIAPGVVATLVGSGFVENATQANFPGAGPVVASDVAGQGSHLTVTIPDGITSGSVTVVTSGGTSPGVSFTYNADVKPPEVSSVTPASNSVNVLVNTTITVRFSEAVKVDTLRADTLALSGPEGAVAATVAPFSNGMGLVLRPLVNLQISSTYTLTILGVEDLAGNPITTPFVTTFTTSSQSDLIKPTVVHINPPSNSSGVALNSTVELEFSEPINPSTITSETVRLSNTKTSQYVPGTLNVDATGRIVTFVPSALLAVATPYRIYWTSGVMDVAGNSLASSGNSNFTTSLTEDGLPPQVVAVNPADGAVGVPTNAVISVQMSEALDPISVTADTVVLESGAAAVPGTLSVVNGNLIKFTPLAPLLPDATYNLTLTAVQDIAGNSMAAPVTIGFTTGGGTDTVKPQISGINPFPNATGVACNVAIQIRFSEVLDPTTVTENSIRLLTSGAQVVSASVALDAAGTTVILTPRGSLPANSPYSVYVYPTVKDVAGNFLANTYSSGFTTGESAQDTTAPHVVGVSPPDGTVGVPVNSRIVVSMSEPVASLSIGAATVQLASASGLTAASLALSNGNQMLTLTPSQDLAISTDYTLVLDGVEDLAGNDLPRFSSSFQTGAVATRDTTAPAVTAVDPDHMATGVSVTPVIRVTFSEPVNPVTVNATTLRLARYNVNEQVPATVTLLSGGTVATLTPTVALLPQQAYSLTRSGVQDFAGNQISSYYTNFTTGQAGPEVTPPEVVLISPANGAVAVPVNASVVLTFSEPLDAATVTSDAFLVYANGARQNITLSRSADNTVVTLDPSSALPNSAAVEVVVADTVRDLSGNRLALFTSEFAVEPAWDRAAPQVAAVRPGNGATGVPDNIGVVLFFNESINPAAAGSAIFVAESGVRVNGSITISGDNQVATFVPERSFAAGALIEVFVTSALCDTSGNPLPSMFQSSFRIAPDPATQTLTVVGFSPPNGSSGMPNNTMLTVRFNKAIDPSTIDATTFRMVDASNDSNVLDIAGTRSLDATGTLLRFVPTGDLPYKVSATLTDGIADTTGTHLILSEYSFSSFFRTVGSADNAAPVVTSISPADGAVGVAINAALRLRFNEAINPFTVDGITVSLSGSDGVAVPGSISFGEGNTLVTIVPQAPLAADQTYTVSIIEVTDSAGNEVVSKTTTFQTGSGPDVQKPGIVMATPAASQSVPVNGLVEVEFDEPIALTTLSSATFYLSNCSTGERVSGSFMVDGSGRLVTFVPSAPLTQGTDYCLRVTTGLQDVAGNPLAGEIDSRFAITSAEDTVTPEVVMISPADDAAGVPINARVRILMSEAVDPISVTEETVVVEEAGVPVPGVLSVTDGNRVITFVPMLPFSPATLHNLNLEGVRDMAGNEMAFLVDSSFTTATAVDFMKPSVLATNPFSGATNVACNQTSTIRFGEVVDPATVNESTVSLYNPKTNSFLSVAVALDATRTMVTITPRSPIPANNQVEMHVSSAVADVAGNTFQSATVASFTTGSVVDDTTPPQATVMNPADGATGMPVNTHVVVSLSESPDLSSVNTTTVQLQSPGGPVPVSIALANSNTLMTITPTQDLVVSTDYTLVLNGIRDMAGNELPLFSSTFQTSSVSTRDTTRPTVTMTNPFNGATSVQYNQTITMRFSEVLDPATVNESTVRPYNASANSYLSAAVALDDTRTVVTITPRSPLPANSQVQMYVLSGVADVAGNSFYAANVATFTTGNVADDTTPPQATVMNPADGATGMPVNSHVVVSLSESPDLFSVNTTTVQLQSAAGPVPVSITLANSNTLMTITPTQDLAVSTDYTLVLNGIRDIAGNALPVSSSTFQTSSVSTRDTKSPSVLGTNPFSGATNVQCNQTTTILFSEILDPVTVNESTVRLYNMNTNSYLSAAVALDDTRTVVTLTPRSPIPTNNKIQLSLAGVADVAGNKITVAAATFTTGTAADDTTPPEVTGISPPDGATAMPVNTRVVISFSEAVDSLSINTATVQLQNSGAPNAASLSLTNGNKTLTITPAYDLAVSTDYTLVLDGVRDVAGNALPGFTSTFQTSSVATRDTTGPTVTMTNPSNGATGVLGSVTPTIQFSEILDPVTVNESTVKLHNPYSPVTLPSAAVTLDATRTMVTITPRSPLPANTKVYLYLVGSADVSGNTTNNWNSISFTTGAQ